MKEKKLVQLLKSKSYKIASSESCTGGLFISTIISVPSASAVVGSSYITYSEEEKTRLCGVLPKTIKEYGVVSEPVAKEMAEGTAKSCRAEVGVGITGVAGPSGGTKEVPVGTVCFGVSVNGNTQAFTCRFRGGRNLVRKKTVRFAINKIIELL